MYCHCELIKELSGIGIRGSIVKTILERKKMKTRLILVIFGLLALCLFNLGFAQKTEVELHRFFGDCFEEFGENTDLDAAYGECGIIQTLTNAFNAQSDTVHVETIPSGWPGTTELNANLAAGTPPDIMVLHGIRIPNYASRGILTPLDDAFADVGIDTSDFTDSARGYVDYNDGIFGLPLDLHGHLWHINLGLWEEAGLPMADGAPVLPIGEAQFREYSEQFKEATGKLLYNVNTNFLSRDWMALVYQQGGAIEDEDGMPTIDSEEGLTALNFLLNLRDEGLIPDNTDVWEPFQNGEAGSIINGTWVVNFLDEQTKDPEIALKNYYVASFPQIYDQPGTWASTHAWIVPLGLNADADKLAAIAEFFKFLNDNNFHWSRTGHISVNQSVLDSDEYLALEHRDEYAAFSTDSIVMPRQNWVTAYETVVDEEFQAAFLGDKTAEEALADAQSRLADFAAFGQ